MDYKTALNAAWNGKAIIFLGSGFSKGAKSANKTNFPSSIELANLLCTEANITINSDLKYASERYIKRKGSQSLINLLNSIFLTNDVTSSQIKIAEVPWKGIYTTNYDNVFEVAARESGKVIRCAELTGQPRHYRDDSSYILHINGFINSLNEDSLFDSFKLTNSSYLTTKFNDSPWSALFVQQVQSAHAVFFVGYSLYDIEIQEILYANKTLKEKTFFIDKTDLNTEELELSEMNEYGSLLPIGTDKFAQDLEEAKLLASTEAAPFILTGITEHFPALDTDQIDIKDDDIYDLLLKGDIKEKLFWAPHTPQNVRQSEYTIHRDELDSLASLDESIKNIVITSDLGNGKTLFLNQLTKIHLAQGRRVFWLMDDTLDCYDDINLICNLSEPITLIIENYGRKLDIIKTFSLKRSEKSILILSDRTVSHEANEERLYYAERIIDPQATREVDLNKLTENEINQFIDYLDEHGLWGDQANKTKNGKYSFITSHCNSQLHGLLLSTIKSPHIQDLFKNLFLEIEGDQEYSKTIISAFVLKMLGVSDPTPHEIAALSKENYIFNAKFKNNKSIRQLFNSSHGGIIPKSSALAEFSLKNYKNIPALIDALIDIAKSTRQKALGSDIYWKYYRELASFKYIQNIIPEKGMRDSLIRFYEGLRKIDIERKNPLFWLQYAMARLTFPDEENLIQAKQYLDTAMSYARGKTNYTTTDIETQYARYYLEYITNLPLSPEEAFEQFSIANDIILRITATEKYKKEPYRPVRLYDRFIKKYGANLSNENLKDIIKSSNAILENAKSLTPRISGDGRVRAAINSAKITINLCNTILSKLER